MVGEHVHGEQARQKHHHDAHGRYKEFPVGTPVMVREERDKSHWLPGTVREQCGPISHLVEMDSGMWCCKHINHLRKVAVASQTPTVEPRSGQCSMCVLSHISPLSESSDSSSEVRTGNMSGARSLEPPSSTTPSTTVVPSSSTATGTTEVPEDASSQSSSTRYPHRHRSRLTDLLCPNKSVTTSCNGPLTGH